MKKCKRKLNMFNFVSKIISIILGISAVVAISFIMYFEVLPLAFLSLVIILILLNNSRLKKWIRSIFLGISVIFIVIFILISIYSVNTLNMFNDIFDLGLRTDNYSVYVLEDSNFDNIESLNNKVIGIIKERSEDLEDKISKEIGFDMIIYDNSVEMIDNLIEGNLDAIVILDANVELLKEESERYNSLRSVYSFSLITKVDTVSKDVDISKDSFVLYISGIDTNGRVYSSARSDVNILAVVNPVNKKILILNTPRDYYIKLPTKDSYDKLTHAGVYGIEESIGALEDLYDVSVNYYVRVNFTTFISIVDALDGITVDVPNSFCEQTSSRESEDEICLSSGIQVLNGEEALALSRTRHIYADGDRSRIKNQMLVLEALIDRALSPKIIIRYNSIISKLSDSVVTNIDEKDVTKLIKSQIEDNSGWNIEMYSVDGIDAYKPTFSAGHLDVYVMKQNVESILIAKEKIKSILNS